MRLLFFIFLTISLMLEISLISLPLLLVSLTVLTVIFKKSEVSFFAIIFGTLLDILSFKSIGISSLFLFLFLFLVLIYQSKFEISTKNFVVISTFLGSLGFLFVEGYDNLIILQAVISSIVALIMFVFIKHFIKIEPKSLAQI